MALVKEMLADACVDPVLVNQQTEKAQADIAMRTEQLNEVHARLAQHEGNSIALIV